MRGTAVPSREPHNGQTLLVVVSKSRKRKKKENILTNKGEEHKKSSIAQVCKWDFLPSLNRSWHLSKAINITVAL